MLAPCRGRLVTTVDLRADPSHHAAPAWRASAGGWLRWPAGTTRFALRTWLALSLALYLAFIFELESTSSTAVCIMLLAQPVPGMVLSKAFYRTLGTLAGVIAAVVLTSLFPQDRTMVLAGFTLWMGLCTALATVLRDFRAYGVVLAGYTVAIISLSNIDAPTATFTAAVDRVAAILVGIAAIAAVNALFTGADASESLLAKLRDGTADLLRVARSALDGRKAPDPETCMALSAALMPLRSLISFAAPELPGGSRRAASARSALLGLFETLTAVQAVGTGLDRMTAPSRTVDQAVALLRRALPSEEPELARSELQAMMAARLDEKVLTLEEAYVLDRMQFLLATLGDVRDGCRSLETGRAPRRAVDVPVHQDAIAVLLNFTRVVVSVGAVCALGVWSGLPATAQTVLFSAVYVSLGSITPNPSAMGTTALVGLPITVALGAVYTFLVLPVIDGFPLLCLSLAPVVLVTCYLMTTGQQGLGAILGTMAVVLIAPGNPQVIDPESFLSTAVMFVVSGIVIFVAFQLVLPVQPAQRRLRLALAVGSNLRKALRDEHRLAQPRASLQYDRLSQFKQWLGSGEPSLARRKMLMRLVDSGNLAFSVRRAWRALDEAGGWAPAELEARARAILPTLSPAGDGSGGRGVPGVGAGGRAAASPRPDPRGLGVARHGARHDQGGAAGCAASNCSGACCERTRRRRPAHHAVRQNTPRSRSLCLCRFTGCWCAPASSAGRGTRY